MQQLQQLQQEVAANQQELQQFAESDPETLGMMVQGTKVGRPQHAKQCLSATVSKQSTASIGSFPLMPHVQCPPKSRSCLCRSVCQTQYLEVVQLPVLCQGSCITCQWHSAACSAYLVFVLVCACIIVSWRLQT
jgi:hypothetical protein